MSIGNDYPAFVCHQCAMKAGGRPLACIGCWHHAICPCCGDSKAVTEPRDYRYPKLVVKYEYRPVEFVSGNGSAATDIRADREAEQSAQRDISEVRPAPQRADRLESRDFSDAGDGVRPCDNTVKATPGISVEGSTMTIRVDYRWICEQISRRVKYTDCCGNINLESLLEAFDSLAREQGG
jgi:hypothetical protein